MILGFRWGGWRIVACLAFGLMALGHPSPLRAQDAASRPCLLEFTGVTRQGVLTTSMRVTTLGDGSKHSFISGGVDATCRGQGNRILADSAEHYGDRRELVLINRVRYTDGEMRLDADRMVYYLAEERMVATGRVTGISEAGTRFRGPELTYLRPRADLRPVSSWRAPGRPTVRVPGTRRTEPRPTSPTAIDSMDITADEVWAENDSLIWARGRVVMERTDLRATADSVFLDQGTEQARLRRDPRIRGLGERPFTMTGVEIDLWSRSQTLERVVAAGSAVVESDSVVLRGDTVDGRLSMEKLERLMAWGGRAYAEAERQEIEADSIDLRMPAQRLEEVHAIGRAISRAAVDTTKITSPDPDWIAGDTVLARFETVPAAPPDTSTATRVREVWAIGSARAFQQLASSDGVRDRPSLSYNRGRRIIIRFAEGEVQRVEVEDQASGLYLEPTPLPQPTPPSSAPAAGRRVP